MSLELALITTLAGEVFAAAKKVCDAIGEALGSEGEEKLVLKVLHDGIVGLRSETKVYEDLIATIPTGTLVNEYSPIIQRNNYNEAIDGFKRALQDTRLLLEWDSHLRGVLMNTFKSQCQRNALKSVLEALEIKSKTRGPPEFIDTVKNATDEIHLLQQKNDQTFKRFWNLYTIDHQPISRRPSMGTIARDHQVGQARDAVLRAFHSRPFAILPGDVSNIYRSTIAVLNRITLAVFNRDDKSAAEYEKLARTIGEAWVSDRVLQETTQARELGLLQTSLFELLWSGLVEQLKDHSAYLSDDPEQAELRLKLVELERGLQGAIVRSKKQCFTIAFCGMVKAGKSLFLNALVGREILPSGELPSTAWPCRLRHVEGQTVPELRFNPKPFLAALKKLQEHQYGQKMKTYQPPPENVFDTLFFDTPSIPSEEEVNLKIIHSQWVDLHRVTRENLLEFEKPGFQLPRTATGEEEVKSLLSQVNDIVRLCQKFDLHFDMSEVDWPLLTIEFSSLQGRKMNGIYEFIDLPGVGEYFRDFKFESLVRLVASDSSAIVPIVSFKEIPRSDWKCLPGLLASGGHGRANVVVSTHLDQVSQENMQEQLRTITKTFWPNSPLDTNRVMACSSLMGLSSRDLLDKSTPSKPSFETVWDKNAVGFHCAKKLLGLANAKANYTIIEDQVWNTQLQKELASSGLPQAIKKLTVDIVDSGRINALLNETNRIIKPLQDIGKLQRRRLLEARRSPDGYSAAKISYDLARGEFEAVLNSWDRKEEEQILENRQILERASAVISSKIPTLINQAIEETLKKWTTADDQSEGPVLVGGDPLGASSGEQRFLVVTSASDAEEFLRRSQSELHSLLHDLKRMYVSTIRRFAADAMEKRFKDLRDAIKNLDATQPDLQEDIIGDLESDAMGAHRLVFKQIRKEIQSTRTRHTARTAFRAIEEMIARPLMRDGGFTIQGDEIEIVVQQRIEDLGFILRAPITVLATLPFVFGLPIWPFVVQSRSYRLEMDIICRRYQDDITNPWVKSLNEEGERSLIGAIKASSKVAKDSVTSALEREDYRYKRELEEKQSKDAAATQYHIAVYGNIVAAEEALKTVLAQVKYLKERNLQFDH